MNKKLVIIVICVAMAALLPMFFSDKKADSILVTINKFADHPALNAASDGVEDALRKRIPSILIDVQDAQGNSAYAFQIAKHQASSGPNAMVGIATPSAQSILKARKNNDIIVSFAAVTDAKGANLTDGENIVGVTDKPPVEDLVRITKKLFPKKRKIGTLFNPGEINSINTIERLKAIAKELDMEIIEAPVNSSSNIKMATQKLVDEVDIIYIPQDNMIVSSIDAVIQITNSHNVPVIDNIPIISNDDTYLSKGVLIALGTNYYKSGQQLGEMVADQIESKTHRNNIRDADGSELQINKELLEKFGIAKSEIEGLLK